MRNICLTVSYDGTHYHGFQSQPKLSTVQDKLEDVLRTITDEDLRINASGRTDAGVHAKGQVINFYTNSSVPINKWPIAMNTRLPKDILVIDAIEVSETFHARKSAISKTYCYTINNNPFPDIFMQHMQLHQPRKLNVAHMKEALSLINGEHDFTSFCSTQTMKDSYTRTVYEAYITDENHVLRLFITGNGFLHNMVRIITGTVMEIGLGKKSVQDMKRIMESKDRRKAGPTAAAHGLMLWEVKY